MKNITPIILSSLFLLLGISILQATTSSNQPDSNRKSSTQISQKIDPELQQLDEATKQASTKVNQLAKDITVRITSTNNGGSGVLIAKKGNTYLILTNAHVTRRTTQFQIQTPDGQKYNAKPIDGGFDRKYDLALLEFTSPKQYQLANLANPGILKPNDRNIYSAGFPFDSKDLRISPGAITQLSDIPFDNGAQIGYEIAKGEKGVRQGMSGGPIFDASGVFLGINTIGAAPILPNYTYNDGSKPLAKLAAKYRNANWGVPVYNFLIQVKPDLLYGYKFNGLEVGKIQRQATLTGYMAKLNDLTRKQTVRIENSSGNGSGVIIAKEGDSYYVLTAKHVVENQKTQQLTTNNKITTYDQDNYTPTSTVLATGLDLAVVKFTSQSNYPTAQLGRYSPNTSDIVLAGGFPGRDKISSPLWQWQLNPGLIYNPEEGKVETQDKNSFVNGYDLIYSSISYGGMSGGPVFDTAGRVIGIHGQAETTEKEEILLGNSQGISIQTFIGIADKLKIKPQLLKIANNQPAKLDTTNRQTTITAMQKNLTPPQPGDDGERWLAYGNQLYRTRQYYDKSVAAFDLAIAKGKGLTGNYGKALSLLDSRKYELAQIAIERAIAAVPANKRANYYYFWTKQSVGFRKLKKYDAALKAINIAIELEPNDPLLRNEKAAILSESKKYIEAIAIYTDLIRTKPEAYAYFNRGMVKSALGNKQEAIGDFDRALAIDPRFAYAYYGRGMVKSALGNKQEAIGNFDRALAINPRFAMAYNNRGLAKSALGNQQGAIGDYDRALATNHQLDLFAMAYNNRGLAKSALGNQQGAIGDYDRALAINPQFAMAYYNRGNAKFVLGNHQGAISDFDRALAINPQFAMAYGNRGVLRYQNLNDSNGALTDLNKSIELDSKFLETYYNRGDFYYSLGNKNSAIADFQKVIALDKSSAVGAIAQGVVYLEQGSITQAMGSFERAAKTSPDTPDIYKYRGLAYRRQGNKISAIQDWRKAAKNYKQVNAQKDYNMVRGWLKELGATE